MFSGLDCFVRSTSRCATRFVAVSLLWFATARALAQADGSFRWSFSVQGYVESSPAIGPDGTIYVGVQTPSDTGWFWAITPSGGLRGRFETPERISSSPAIDTDGTVYVGCFDGNLYAFYPDGTKKWTFPTTTFGFIFSSPVIGPDGTIYFGAGDLVFPEISAFYAITRDGKLKWAHDAQHWIDSSPAIGPDGTIYYGSWDGNVYALTSEGHEKWKRDLSAPVVSSPVVGRDGTIYVGSTVKTFYALGPERGQTKWQFDSSKSFTAAAALGADGTIYIGSTDGTLYARNSDGTFRWNYNIGSPIVSTPAVRSDGLIIFGGEDGRVHTVDTEGTAHWVYTSRDKIDGSPAIGPDGSIYIGSFDGKLYALNGTAGLSIYSPWPMFQHDPVHSGRAPNATTGRLINLSTRGRVGPGTNLIGGFVVRGTATRPYVVRAVGPTLAQFGVPNPLTDPSLVILNESTGATVAASDNWDVAITATMAAMGAFPLPTGSRDAAVVPSLSPTSYTGIVNTVDGSAGVAMVEVYNGGADIADARLVNLAARGHVGVGADALFSGLVIGGGAPLRVLIRAVGPGLTAYGVTDPVMQPTMTVYSGQTVIASNSGWSTTNPSLKGDLAGAAKDLGAFALADGSADCAVLLTQTPGAYTIQVSGAGASTGEALVEVYAAP
jgi:outer membrane protein assembly factor BamB